MAKTCKIGKSCGSSCISKTKSCVVNVYMPGLSDFLKTIQRGWSDDDDLVEVSAEEMGSDSPSPPLYLTLGEEGLHLKGIYQVAPLDQEDEESRQYDWDSLLPLVDDQKNYLGRGGYGQVMKVNEDTVLKCGDIRRDELNILKEAGEIGIGPKVIAARVNDQKRQGVIVMERIKGKEVQDLDEMDPSKEMDLARDNFWKARAKMHRAGISHNDLHNSNVMVNGVEVKFVDFGLSTKNYTQALVEATQVFGSKFFSSRGGKISSERQAPHSYLEEWSGSRGLNERDSGHNPPTPALEQMAKNFYVVKNIAEREIGFDRMERLFSLKRIYSPAMAPGMIDMADYQQETFAKMLVQKLYEGV